ncbi:hypothetical protein KIMH_03480 [Bombiscardovia apis]|uniref:Uncharacterized protein n=1 Tax=Bombiscardovia apis TaxID=2932182 RepID=A0ABN6SDX4_9BIFI|nr:hypothetical protein KIMH_03480 [Bombiscardovia apis]
MPAAENSHTFSWVARYVPFLRSQWTKTRNLARKVLAVGCWEAEQGIQERKLQTRVTLGFKTAMVYCKHDGGNTAIRIRSLGPIGRGFVGS